MNGKPIPGPWRVVDYTNTLKGYIAIVGSNGEHVCDMFPHGLTDGKKRPPLDDYRATAKAIAAAFSSPIGNSPENP